MDTLQNQIIDIIRNTNDISQLHDYLVDYHEHDIASVFEFLSDDELKKLYACFNEQELSDIFSYIEDANLYLTDFNKEQAADIIELMDSDDALTVLENFDEKERNEIIDLIEEEVREDIELIDSYEDNQIGSYMTNNYITIKKDFTIRQAMKVVIEEAENNDNFTTIYVVNDDDTLFGTVELKDLIKARATDNLLDIIKMNYPTIIDTDLVSNAIITLKEYDMDSIAVTNDKNEFLGVITPNDIVEVVDDELSEDYAKLAGLSSGEDLDEGIFLSVRKRIPWLCILLILGIFISIVMGLFESAIVAVPVIVFFQSMILGMGGNVGTQSLAVTIRALSDEDLTRSKIFKLVFKEMRIALFNGLFISSIAFAVVFGYLLITHEIINANNGFNIKDLLLTAFVVSISLFGTILISGFIGTTTPIVLKKLKIDPAVASGPFITTINDITAIVIYYGIALLMFSHFI